MTLFRRPLREIAGSHVYEEAPGAADAASTLERVRLLTDAIEALPARCRQVFVMRKLHGLSQRETAARLGLSERTVEVQVSRGMQRCEEFLRHRGVTGLHDHES